MVEIRTLKPLVQIRMPQRPRLATRPQYKVVVRYNKDHPPPTPQPTPCRLWQGVEGTDGYGRRKIRDDDGTVRSSSMHRWVMEQVMERRLKPSEVVLHACDNRLCYRAEHLSIGTVADNNADMKAKGRNSPPPVNVFHGECHPMAKLAEWQVRRIRGHYQSGLSVKTIAGMFDVSPTTIRRIIRGVRWNYVGDSTQFVKPPPRDLIAEAQARIDAAAEPAASEHAPKQRIKPVKHLTIRERTPDE